MIKAGLTSLVWNNIPWALSI